jgi:DnaJ-class molecular chaperone
MCRNMLITIYSPCVYRCKKCKGTKTVKEKTRQEIHVERGMTNNQRIILAGAGDQQVGGSPQTGENSKN